MKAARFSMFGGPEVLEIVDIPEPHPGVGEIRIRVHAAGVNASDWKKRQGLMDQDLPQTMGYEAAGVVDEIGAEVSGVAVGDRVFGASPYGAAQAELAVLSYWAALGSLDFVHAAAIPAAAETAARALDWLGVVAGRTVVINGASGNVGSAAVQLAVERGARVIGTGSRGAHDALAAMGAVPVEYGDGLIGRLREIAPSGVDSALDVAGNGILPELVELTGAPERVVTVADYLGARATGVHFSRGDDGRAEYALAEAARLAERKSFVVNVGAVFPLSQVSEAHRAGESGAVHGKIILTVE